MGELFLVSFSFSVTSPDILGLGSSTSFRPAPVSLSVDTESADVCSDHSYPAGRPASLRVQVSVTTTADFSVELDCAVHVGLLTTVT